MLSDCKIGNSISVDFTEDTKKRLERRLFMLFIDNLAVVSFWGSLTLQDKYDIHTLSENINFISNRCEIGQKGLPKVRFSTCF